MSDRNRDWGIVVTKDYSALTCYCFTQISLEVS